MLIERFKNIFLSSDGSINDQGLLNTFTMNLHDSNIKPQDHILFLGVYFDTRLTWKIHLEHLAVKTKAKWNYIMQRSRSLAHLFLQHAKNTVQGGH